MSAEDGWLLVVVGYAILLAWPMSTLGLISFAVRYVAAHRVASVRRAGGRHRTTPGHLRRASPPRTEPYSTTGGTPEHFWIIVPALNEERVVGNTVTAALTLGGFGGTLTRVLVVDDGSDDRTPEVLAGIDHPRLYVLRRELPDARKGKGEALNAAYRAILGHTRAEGVDPAQVVVGIIDGDGQGSHNILLEVSRMMRDPQVGAVQVRVRIRNRNKLLGAVQDLEFGAIVSACQTLRDTIDTVGLGGNGQFTRLSALAELGDSPWSGCLVEDLELGLRMHLDGLGVRYTSRAAVTQQGLVDVRRLTRQRTRWAQGNLQCARYLRALITSPRIRKTALLELLHYLVSPWLNALVTVFLAGMVAVAAAALVAGHPMPYLASWAAMAESGEVWAAVTVFPGLVWALVHRHRLSDETLPRLLVAALAYPAFLLLGLVATYRAIVRQARGQQAWAKTERLIEPLQHPLDVALAA